MWWQQPNAVQFDSEVMDRNYSSLFPGSGLLWGSQASSLKHVRMVYWCTRVCDVKYILVLLSELKAQSIEMKLRSKEMRSCLHNPGDGWWPAAPLRCTQVYGAMTEPWQWKNPNLKHSWKMLRCSLPQNTANYSSASWNQRFTQHWIIQPCW